MTAFGEEETLYIDSEKFKMFDDRIEFYEYSEITKSDFFLKSDEFTILRENGEERTIIAEKGVYVEFETGQATSQTLDYDLKESKGTMTGDVEALIETSEGSKTKIFCDILSINNEENKFEGEQQAEDGTVRIEKEDLTARSRRFEFLGDQDLLRLYGSVFIDDPENNRQITGDAVTINLSDDSIEGQKVLIDNTGEEDQLQIESDDFKTLEDRTEFYAPSTVQKNNFLLRSPEFTIYKEDGEDRTVRSEKRSYVEFETGRATSSELDYDLKTEKGTLTGEVVAIIKPEEEATPVEVTCDTLTIDSPSKRYAGEVETSEKVRLNRGELYAESKAFVYDAQSDEIVLKREVYIDDLSNNQRVWGEEVTMDLETDAFRGRNIRLARENEGEQEREKLQMSSSDFTSTEEKNEFRGPSEISRKDFRLVSDRFTIFKEDGKERTIQATEGVFIEFESGKATGTEFDYDLETREGTLTKDVIAEIDQEESTETIDVECDKLVIQDEKGIFKGYSGEENEVIIRKGNMTTRSNEFEYDKTSEELILTGDVFVEDPDNRRKIQGERLLLDLATDEIEGKNVQMTIITKE